VESEIGKGATFSFTLLRNHCRQADSDREENAKTVCSVSRTFPIRCRCWPMSIGLVYLLNINAVHSMKIEARLSLKVPL